MIAQAASDRCQLVVLPECLDLGWTHPSAVDKAEPVPGRTFNALAQAAARHALHVVAGITERCNGRIYNTAVLIGPEGELIAMHRKINELDFARELYSCGESLGVASTGIGKVGLTVCADNWPGSLCLGHALGRMGADIMPSPSAWAVDADHDQQRDPYGAEWRAAYQELATQYSLTIIGVSNVGKISAGPWAGRKCIGCSLAVGAGGVTLAQGPYDEEAFIAFETGGA
jgi:predicted amidohydrolase